MSDLIKRHRAAADALRHQLGNASAAQCKFHEDTADELERLRELIENDAKEIGSYREGTGLRGEWKNQQAEIERLRAALEDIAGYTGRSWAKKVARDALVYDQSSG